MSRVDEIEVHLDDVGLGQVFVGTVRPSFAGPRNLASSSFQYDPGYLARRGAFAISPDLPMHAARSWAPESHVLFGAFEDASPDEWGQKLIAANHADRLRRHADLPRRIGPWDYLLGVSDFARIGALRFRRVGTDEWLSTDGGVANLHELDRIVAAAARYEADEASEEDVASRWTDSLASRSRLQKDALNTRAER